MKCKKCGEENKKDANFCINCGNNLKEEGKDKSSSLVSTFFKSLEGIFKSPAKTMKSFIKEDNYMMSMIYLAVNILVLSLVTIGLLKYFSGVIATTYKPYVDYPVHSLSTSFDISYLKTFLLVIIASSLCYGTLSGMVYLINTYLFKDKGNYKKTLTWLGINSLVMTMSYIVVFIVSLASFKLGIIIYLAFMLIYVYNLFTSFKHITNIDENYRGYALGLSLLTTIIIVVFILPAIFY